MKVLVTGGGGFVGRAVVERLASDVDFDVRASVRTPVAELFKNADYVSVAEIGCETQWAEALARVSCVVHTAGRVHVTTDRAADPAAEFRRVNVEGTMNLARQAAEAGVRRFIFISSIKVNGECTQAGKIFGADDEPAPVSPYGVSKLEAEQGLRAYAATTNMEVVIIRPVLVYGPGVKANFRSLMRWLHRGVPLPLGAVNNRRSLLAIDNLVDLIVRCLHHPAAAGQIFLAGDGEDLSTTELLQRLGQALGKPARLFSVPEAILEAGVALVGRQDAAQRLCSSLQVDISKARDLLGWTPCVTVDEGLRKAAEGFLKA